MIKTQSHIRMHLEMYFYHNYPFQISIVIVSIIKHSKKKVLPGIVHVKNNLVDDVLWTDETLNVFKNFSPEKKKDLKSVTLISKSRYTLT